MDHHQIPYHFDVVDSFLDVSDCFRFNSESGENILSFILECDVRQLLPAIRREIVDYIQELSFYNQGVGSYFIQLQYFPFSKRHVGKHQFEI